MEFLPDDIARYVEDHTSPESDLLKRISRDTHAQVLMPRMLSGHVQGRFLAMISQFIKPKFIPPPIPILFVILSIILIIFKF